MGVQDDSFGRDFGAGVIIPMVDIAVAIGFTKWQGVA